MKTYCLYRLQDGHPEKLAHPSFDTRDEADSMAKRLTIENGSAHLVVNEEYQVQVSQFNPDPGTLLQTQLLAVNKPEGRGLSLLEAIEASRRTEQIERQKHIVSERARSKAAQRRRREDGTRPYHLCAIHQKDLSAAQCSPGFRFCVFMKVRRIKISVDKPPVPCEDAGSSNTSTTEPTT